MFHQIIASAISNEVVPYSFFVIQKMVNAVISNLEEGWSFKHHSFHRMANYGVLRARFNEDGLPEIYSELKTWSKKHEVHCSTTERHHGDGIKQKLSGATGRHGRDPADPNHDKHGQFDIDAPRKNLAN